VARLLGTLIGPSTNIILIPVAFIFAIPMVVLKARRDQKKIDCFLREQSSRYSQQLSE
jgi:hypothetical protein